MKAPEQKPDHLCIYEDAGFADLLPLTHTRPSFELRCGLVTLRQKITRLWPDHAVTLLCRDEVAAPLREALPDMQVNELPERRCLFVNGRTLLHADAPAAMQDAGDCLYVSGDEIIAASLSPKAQDALRGDLGAPLQMHRLEGLSRVEIGNTKVLRYFWDLIHENRAQIQADFDLLFDTGEILGRVYPRVTILERENLYIGAGASVSPGVVLDAEQGPIVVGENSRILANTTIVGPAAIGSDCVVNAGARILAETTIGPYCKVGGEIAESIIQGYSNKQHDGFLGHAYLGEWVNLGADTNNSDLKNNYSTVVVEIGGEKIDSGSLFVGSVIGDHSKTGINTMLNTGTVIGAFSNVFGPGFPPKAVASFAWGGAEGLAEHRLEKALVTAQRVMQRRGREMSAALEACYRSVYEKTQAERRRAGLG